MCRCFLPVAPRSGQAQPTVPDSRKEGSLRHLAAPESRKEVSQRYGTLSEPGQESNPRHPAVPESGQEGSLRHPALPESRKEGSQRYPTLSEAGQEGQTRHPAVPEFGQEGNPRHSAVPESSKDGSLRHPAVPEPGQSSDPPKASEHEDSVVSAKSFVRQRSGSTSMVSVKRKRFEVAASALAAPLTAVDKRGGRDRAASFGGGQVARLR
jgi:hypothetical protein